MQPFRRGTVHHARLTVRGSLAALAATAALIAPTLLTPPVSAADAPATAYRNTLNNSGGPKPMPTNAPEGAAERPVTMDVGISSEDLERVRNGQRPKGTLGTQPLRTLGGTVPAESFTEAAAAARAQLKMRYEARAADDVPPSSRPPAEIKDTPNAELLKECFDGKADSDYGNYVNRYTYCQSRKMTIRFFEVSPNKPPKYHATTRFVYELFAQGDNKNRHIRVFGRMKPGSADYDWPWYDDLLQTPKIIKMTMTGECDAPERECSGLSGSPSLPFGSWNSNRTWFAFDIADSSGSAGTAQGRDKIAFKRWYLGFSAKGEGYETMLPGRSSAPLMRCDSGQYFSPAQKNACVFPGSLSILNYYATPGSPTEQVGKHIADAQYTPDTTYPRTAPAGTPNPRAKRIPGAYFNAPLHRITEADPEWKTNNAHKNAACKDRGDYKGMGLPTEKQPKSGQQCDEYPFRTTLEGAASKDWDFSVRAVDRSDNASAGSRLKLYVLHERILRWDAGLADPQRSNDAYWVNIRYSTR
ncbi:NucA/NucB deoxyribonuclease domain-containing protein [Streptomyces triculaminicus]|uniref:NucA/NucB deoxyribonuclease domain-containing protein n=1 Tax=Streptomyces triculaminicus TaxID=2816232 RepID=UPI0037D4AFCA